MEDSKNDSCKSLSRTNGAHSDSVMSPISGECNFGSLFKMEIGATSSSHKQNISEGIYTLGSFIFVWSRILYANRHFMAWKSNLSPYVNFAMKSQLATSHYALYFTFLCLFILSSTYFMLRF